MKSILVTGAAGFIGANLVLRLLGSQEPLWVKLVNLQYKKFTNKPSDTSITLFAGLTEWGFLKVSDLIFS